MLNRSAVVLAPALVVSALILDVYAETAAGWTLILSSVVVGVASAMLVTGIIRAVNRGVAVDGMAVAADDRLVRHRLGGVRDVAGVEEPMQMMRRPARLPWYPPVLGVLVVLALWLDSSEPIQALGRPLLLAAVIPLAALAVALIFVRERNRAALLATLGVLAVIRWDAAILVLLVASAPLGVGLLRERRVVALSWSRVSERLNVIAGIALVVSLLGVAGRPSIDVAGGVTGRASDGPDIYLVLLDGYPRADTLRDEFGFDNGPFLESMEGLGFEVAAASRSNYNATLLTLASMLNMRHIDELVPDPPDGLNAQLWELVRHIDGAAAFGELREQGYEVVAVPSGLPFLTPYAADRVLDTGQITSFEMALLKPAWPLAEAKRAWFQAQHRDRIIDSLDALAALAAEDSERPRFVLAHVMSPHPPIVFEADGSPRDGWGCPAAKCGFWDAHSGPEIVEPVTGHITHLNSLVLDSIGRIIEHSERPAVVVVFSDHGFRHELDPDEMLHSLFLARTLGHPNLFPDDATPINVLPRIFNAYLGTEIGLAPKDSYLVDLLRMDVEGPFPLTRR